ncbi:MAG: S24/S26 family peptidase [Caldilineales bacterium]|nr:S24/S26 family peptidase [Caldilineales bacterium]
MVWQVQGDSMSPTLPDSCAIEVLPLNQKPEIGAIVVFIRDDEMVAHRLVRFKREYWLTQGDGHSLPDRPIPPLSVIGQVTKVFIGEREFCIAAWRTRWRWIGRYHALRLLRALRKLRDKNQLAAVQNRA